MTDESIASLSAIFHHYTSVTFSSTGMHFALKIFVYALYHIEYCLKFKQYFIMNNHNEDWAAGNLPI